MKKQISLWVICALLITLFLYASVSKYIDMRKFEFDMHNQPFPVWLSNIIVKTLPPLEILISLFLLIDRTRLITLYVSLFLMTLFTGYTGLVLFHFFNRVPCACGGVIQHLSWKQHLILNTFFTIISIIGIRLSKQIDNKTRASKLTLTV